MGPVMSSEKCQPQRVWTIAQNGEFISEGAYFMFFKVNSVQEACAKSFAVHILKF